MHGQKVLRLPLEVVRQALGIFLGAHDLDADKRLIANNRAVVSRRDRVRLSPTDDLGAAVLHLDAERSRDGVSGMGDLAAVRPGDLLDAGRPPPSRLELEPRQRDAMQADDLDAGLGRRAQLISASSEGTRRTPATRRHSGVPQVDSTPMPAPA